MNWFVNAARDLPWRRTLDPYAIWVSEIMLQQTQVKTVVPYFERWMRELPDVASLAVVSSARLHKLWEGLGYYTRARNLQKAAVIVRDTWGGRPPRTLEDLVALPGIGRYTAGAIGSIAFNQPLPIVDGNVIRVLARIFAIPGNPRDPAVNATFWQVAAELVTCAGSVRPVELPGGAGWLVSGNCSVLNQALMELGATLCTPTNPACHACPVRRSCLARSADRIGRFPETPARARSTPRRFVALVVRRGKRVLVRQRPAGVVNAHLWEFPNAEVPPDDPDPLRTAAGELGIRLRNTTPLGAIRHSITRYRILMDSFAASIQGRVPASLGVLIPVRDLSTLAFAAAHQKLLRKATKGSHL